MNIIGKLKKNKLFYNFDDKEINSIFESLKGRIVKYPRGMIVAYQGTQISEIGILLTGTLLKFTEKNDKSKEAQGMLEPGQMFGEVEGFLKSRELQSSYVAAEESTVLYITIATIVAHSTENSPSHKKLLENMLACLAERIASINKDTEYLIIKSMRLKIAKLIYDRYLEQDSLNVELGINRNEMAEYLNVSRPSMSREMIRMREEGIIDFWKDKITIKDLDALKNIVGFK